jgi:hypothetical protein
LDLKTGEPLAPAVGKKARRQMSASTRRILLIILGVLVAVASVGGFYFTSEAFDERTPVLVTAVDIQKGQVVSAGNFTSELAVMGSIPHIPYTPEAPFAFEGLIANQTIPAGAVVMADMMIVPETQPTGNQREVTVQFDTSLATTGVFDGDEVLLVDPGALPSAEDPGRPRQTLEPIPFVLQNFDGAAMRMFVDPNELIAWRNLPTILGAAPMILPVPLGGDAQEFAQVNDEAWQAQWELLTLAAAVPLESAGPQPGPGELEVVVAFDTSLVPSVVSDGSRVLMIDPGLPPTREDIGRPRMVLRTIVLENFDGSAMRLFAPPEEWARWSRLPEELGAAPMVLPIPEGTDIDDFTQRLNEEWDQEWSLAVNEVGGG